MRMTAVRIAISIQGMILIQTAVSDAMKNPAARTCARDDEG